MRVLIQRVSRAKVSIGGEEVGCISKGLLLLIGFSQDDTESQLNYLGEKIVKLRIFSDREGKMNLSALDLKKEILAVPQFTLYADCRKGNRPGFSNALDPSDSKGLFLTFLNILRGKGLTVESGVFGATMQVELVNDGPVTILLDTKELQEGRGH